MPDPVLWWWLLLVNFCTTGDGTVFVGVLDVFWMQAVTHYFLETHAYPPFESEALGEQITAGLKMASADAVDSSRGSAKGRKTHRVQILQELDKTAVSQLKCRDYSQVLLPMPPLVSTGGCRSHECST